jgi:hypothetical protein
MRNLPHKRILGIALGLGLFFQTQAQTFEKKTASFKSSAFGRPII